MRDEYKVLIYKHYFILSIRFLLTVHDIISQSHLKKLDTFTDKFVKKKSGRDYHPVQQMLLYIETWPRHHFNIHPVQNKYDASIHYRKRILSETVNCYALQFKLDREKNWLCKNSVTDYAENVSPSHIRELWSSRNA